MNNRQIVTEVDMRDSEFVTNYFRKVPPFGLYVQLPSGHTKAVMMTTHLEAYYHQGKACVHDNCSGCHDFFRLVSIDQYVRSDEFANLLTYDDLMFYLNGIFVQNEFMLDNLPSLLIQYPTLRDFSVYAGVFKSLSFDIIENHLKYMRDILNGINTEAFTPAQYVEYRGFLANINAEVEKTVNNFERVDRLCKQREKESLSPSELFRLYKGQLEAVIIYAQSVPGLSKSQRKSLGSSVILSKLEALLSCDVLPIFQVFYLVLKGRDCFHTQKEYAQGSHYLDEAEKCRLKLLEEKKISESDSADLMNTIHSVRLLFLTSRLRNSPTNTLAEIQAAVTVVMNLSESIQYSGDLFKRNLQFPLNFLFDSLLAFAQKKFLFVKQLDHLLPLREYLAQLALIIDRYQRTASHDTSMATAAGVIMLRGHYEDFEKALDTKETLLKRRQDENEKALAVLNEREAEYNKRFPALIAKFNDKKRMRSPFKLTVLPDFLLEKEPSKPDEVVQPPAPQKISVAQACVNFFARKKLKQCRELIDGMPDQDKPEIMLYIGDRYMFSRNQEKALYWYKNAIEFSKQLPALHPALERAMYFSLDNCEKELQDEFDYFQREYEASIASRESFKEKLAREVLTDAEQMRMSHEEIMVVGQAQFDALGRRNEANGRGPSQPAEERRAIFSHKNAVEKKLKSVITLHEDADYLFNKPAKQASVTQTKASLFNNQKKATPSSKPANARRRKRK